MKKQLLLGSALLAAISAFPQNGRTKAQPSNVVDFAGKVSAKYQRMTNPVEPTTPFQPASTQPVNTQPQARTTAVTPTTTIWKQLTGSENIYGMLVSGSSPLQYNDQLGRISFVHRKSHTYISSPMPAATASTGVIVAEITNSWGDTWDSTCIWNNNTYWGRYPQGGIFNPPSNTPIDMKKTFIVGTGPVTDGGTSNGWKGNWFASKRLDTLHGLEFTNAAGAGASQQFIANSGTFNPAVGGKIDFARLDFAATDNGVVRSLGIAANDVNNTTSNVTYGYRGARIAKGTFNSGTSDFSWHFDSIIPSGVRTNVGGGGYKMMSGEPHMAWSEDGMIGYVWHIGCLLGATGNNQGYQPIVSKTTDGGATWTQITGIDFNNNAFKAPVLDHIPAVKNNTTLTIPQFNGSEGIDGVVDMNGKLHIVSTIVGSSKSHGDSLGYSYQFLNSSDGETYTWPHQPGERPYIYDFTGDGNGPWTVTVVDSMSSEEPGTASADFGFGYNPWDVDENGNKINVDARLQASRTPDGKYIVYTWSESDTNTTFQQVKWNTTPNLKARMLNVQTGAVHPNEISITDPSPADPNAESNAAIRGFAFNYYASPTCAKAITSTGVAIILPMTVSNNPSIHQLEPVTHWYSSVILNFDNVSETVPPAAYDFKGYVGIAENALNSTRSSVIFPNPAKGNATLAIELKDNSKVEVSVMNMVGQEVKSNVTEAQVGQNKINVDLNGLSKGVYMVNVKIGGTSSTKKLVVE